MAFASSDRAFKQRRLNLNNSGNENNSNNSNNNSNDTDMLMTCNSAHLAPPALSPATIVNKDSQNTTISSPQGQAKPEWASPVQSFKAYLNQMNQDNNIDEDEYEQLSPSRNSNNNGRKRSASTLASLFSIGKSSNSDSNSEDKDSEQRPGSPHKRKRRAFFPVMISTQPRTLNAKCEKPPVYDLKSSTTTASTNINFNSRYISFPAIDEREDDDS